MAGDHVVDRLAGAPVRDVVEPDTGFAREPCQQHMLVGADAGGGAAHARPLLHQRDEVGDRVHRRERGMHRERLRLPAEQRDREEILQVVDAQAQHVRRARDVVIGDEDGIAVGRTLDRRVDADRAPGAGAVLDEHLLAELARHVIADHASDEVEPAAGRERHDEAQRTARKGAVLRVRKARAGQSAAQRQGGADGIPDEAARVR